MAARTRRSSPQGFEHCRAFSNRPLCAVSCVAGARPRHRLDPGLRRADDIHHVAAMVQMGLPLPRRWSVNHVGARMAAYRAHCCRGPSWGVAGPSSGDDDARAPYEQRAALPVDPTRATLLWRTRRRSERPLRSTRRPVSTRQYAAVGAVEQACQRSAPRASATVTARWQRSCRHTGETATRSRCCAPPESQRVCSRPAVARVQSPPTFAPPPRARARTSTASAAACPPGRHLAGGCRDLAARRVGLRPLARGACAGRAERRCALPGPASSGASLSPSNQPRSSASGFSPHRSTSLPPSAWLGRSPHSAVAVQAGPTATWCFMPRKAPSHSTSDSGSSASAPLRATSPVERHWRRRQ